MINGKERLEYFREVLKPIKAKIEELAQRREGNNSFLDVPIEELMGKWKLPRHEAVAKMYKLDTPQYWADLNTLKNEEMLELFRDTNEYLISLRMDSMQRGNTMANLFRPYIDSLNQWKRESLALQPVFDEEYENE